MKKLIGLSLIFLLILCACNKDKPKAGGYLTIFKYDDPNIATESAPIEIIHVDKNSLEIKGYSNNSYLKKSKRKITGEMISIPGIGSFITIDGEWKRKAGKQKYVISGTFKQMFTQAGGTFEATGTFEMTSY